jgi:hypothetical protein
MSMHDDARRCTLGGARIGSLKAGRKSEMHKLILVTVFVGVLLGGCAGAPSASSGDGGSITMYGTIDEGISVRK